MALCPRRVRAPSGELGRLEGLSLIPALCRRGSLLMTLAHRFTKPGLAVMAGDFTPKKLGKRLKPRSSERPSSTGGIKFPPSPLLSLAWRCLGRTQSAPTIPTIPTMDRNRHEIVVDPTDLSALSGRVGVLLKSGVGLIG